MSRTSEYGSPFLALDAGRVNNDKENRRRLRALRNTQLQRFKQMPVYLKSGLYLSPFVGLVLGKFYNDAYVAPKSIYMRFMILGVTSFICFKAYSSLLEHYVTKDLLTGFQTLDKGVQNAIENNDARYAKKTE